MSALSPGRGHRVCTSWPRSRLVQRHGSSGRRPIGMDGALLTSLGILAWGKRYRRSAANPGLFKGQIRHAIGADSAHGPPAPVLTYTTVTRVTAPGARIPRPLALGLLTSTAGPSYRSQLHHRAKRPEPPDGLNPMPKRGDGTRCRSPIPPGQKGSRQYPAPVGSLRSVNAP
jgi:hypothetical protein